MKDANSSNESQTSVKEQVNHPSHYNSHPSGIEAIFFCEVMEFNTGNSFKYIFRRGDKGNPKQDLQKAQWYINREIERLSKTIQLSCSTDFVSNQAFDRKHLQEVQTLLVFESNATVREIFSHLMQQQNANERVKSLETCSSLLSLLLNPS